MSIEYQEINQIPATAATILGADSFEIEQSGESKQASISVLSSYLSTLYAPIDDGYFEVSGVVEYTGSTWALIENSEHHSTGISSITNLVDGGFQINYDQTASSVLFLVATPDETYAIKGFNCGASVGLSSSEIYLAGKYTLLAETTKCAFFFNRSTTVNGYIYYAASAWNITNSVGVSSVTAINSTGSIIVNHASLASNNILITPRNRIDYAQAEFMSYSATELFIRFVQEGRVPNQYAYVVGANIWIHGRFRK